MSADSRRGREATAAAGNVGGERSLPLLGFLACGPPVTLRSLVYCKTANDFLPGFATVWCGKLEHGGPFKILEFEEEFKFIHLFHI